VLNSPLFEDTGAIWVHMRMATRAMAWGGSTRSPGEPPGPLANTWSLDEPPGPLANHLRLQGRTNPPSPLSKLWLGQTSANGLTKLGCDNQLVKTLWRPDEPKSIQVAANFFFRHLTSFECSTIDCLFTPYNRRHGDSVWSAHCARHALRGFTVRVRVQVRLPIRRCIASPGPLPNTWSLDEPPGPLANHLR
jgi:hypothetical protein